MYYLLFIIFYMLYVESSVILGSVVLELCNLFLVVFAVLLVCMKLKIFYNYLNVFYGKADLGSM